VTEDAIRAIRIRAEFARRLANERKEAGTKIKLLQIASMLDADADQLEATAEQQSAHAVEK
jgi:hypothetical protein